jgi:glutaryl-CoA dehydrogenase
MDNVGVPAENMFAGVKGLRGPVFRSKSGSFWDVWGALGAAEACCTIESQYTMDRMQFENSWLKTS